MWTRPQTGRYSCTQDYLDTSSVIDSAMMLADFKTILVVSSIMASNMATLDPKLCVLVIQYSIES